MYNKVIKEVCHRLSRPNLSPNRLPSTRLCGCDFSTAARGKKNVAKTNGCDTTHRDNQGNRARLLRYESVVLAKMHEATAFFLHPAFSSFSV